jgi:diguanylate cyclase (GGDEF)-like protein/PAS domain S-box-containing protein
MPANDGSEFYKAVLDNIYDGVYFVDRERRITYWNKGAERITGYTAGEVIGTKCSDNVLMHVDEKGQPLCGAGTCPAVASMQSAKPCEAEVYLHHRDGHRVPINTRISPLADNGDVLGAVEVFTDNSSVLEARQQIEELERLALLDQLTDVGNRRYAQTRLEARLRQLERYGWPFSVLFLDIDLFKRINDLYGHEVGDRVLRVVARSTKGSLRSFDMVSRWGGEEFVVMVENVDEQQTRNVAQKVRAMIQQSSLDYGAEIIRVTVSVGATAARPDDSMDTLIDRADKLMYLSKKDGRNRVTFG